MGKLVREIGGEYGAVTGRPRRCGWLDMVLLKYAVMVNGVDELAITKLDVLDTLDEIGVCTGYKLDGHSFDLSTADASVLQQVQPAYTYLPGWKSETTHAKTISELPANARKYLDYVETALDVKIKIVSVGQDRERTILL
jgi:adenylosuccinate synthase